MDYPAMTDITDEFNLVAFPRFGIVVYQKPQQNHERQTEYIEYFEIGSNGQPINAHPLRTDECVRLAKALGNSQREKTRFLRPRGVLPVHILQLDQQENGYAMWYTPASRRVLLHSKQMGIPNGEASIPALLWKATTTHLQVFALATDERPTSETPLFTAPFGNINGETGGVCMGTVPVSFGQSVSLDEFIARWEEFFFNSYFSHLNTSQPVKSNFIQLWKRLLKTSEAFPTDELVPTLKTLASL